MYLLMVARKVPKVAFCGTVYSGLWFGGLGRVDQTSFYPLKPSFGVDSSPKVSWVKTRFLFSSKPFSRVWEQLCGLSCLEKGFRSHFSREKCAPRSSVWLFSGHAQPSFRRWLKNAWKVSPATFLVAQMVVFFKVKSKTSLQQREKTGKFSGEKNAS